MDVGLTDWDIVRGLCRDAGKLLSSACKKNTIDKIRIVEYATRDQAQQAVNTLSNQNLMGRLVYVREVSLSETSMEPNGWRRNIDARRSIGP